MRVIIPNIILSDYDFDDSGSIAIDRFYCDVGISNVRKDAQGNIVQINAEGIGMPFILIGCDFLRSCDYFIGDENKISVGKLNSEKYFATVECNRGESAFLFTGQQQ